MHNSVAGRVIVFVWTIVLNRRCSIRAQVAELRCWLAYHIEVGDPVNLLCVCHSYPNNPSLSRFCFAQAPPGMSVLQLRRFLRAMGQPTVGLKPVLSARLEKAVSSGALKSYVANLKEKPREAVDCGEFCSVRHVKRVRYIMCTTAVYSYLLAWLFSRTCRYTAAVSVVDVGRCTHLFEMVST